MKEFLRQTRILPTPYFVMHMKSFEPRNINDVILRLMSFDLSQRKDENGDDVRIGWDSYMLTMDNIPRTG